MAKQPVIKSQKTSISERFLTLIGAYFTPKFFVSWALNTAKKLVWWHETTEEKQIANMAKYLKASNEVLEELRKNGLSKKELQELARELNLPVIQAMMDRMVLNRKIPLPAIPAEEEHTVEPCSDIDVVALQRLEQRGSAAIDSPRLLFDRNHGANGLSPRDQRQSSTSNVNDLITGEDPK